MQKDLNQFKGQKILLRNILMNFKNSQKLDIHPYIIFKIRYILYDFFVYFSKQTSGHKKIPKMWS